MRKGRNPQKAQQKINLSCQHRVVVVVFIPIPEGYYSKMLKVFKLCLDSLIKTNAGNYKITVVDNGCCKELKELLGSYDSDEIDCIITHSSNIGKIDALIGAARGAREEYITLSDADILFQEGWDSDILEVFETFKNVGSVSPIPFRHGLFYGTSSVFKQILLKNVKFSYTEIPENFEDHNRYLASINWNQENDSRLKWPVIEKNGVRAIIGSGHQVLTIKREILFTTVPIDPSLTLVGGNSEYKYVDEPIDKAGFMRLSTFRNRAYHMGNELEAWMSEQFERSGIEINPVAGNKIDKTGKRKNQTYENFAKQKAYGLRKKVLKKMFRLFYNH